MFQVSTTSFHTTQSLFQEAQYGFVQQDGAPAHTAMLAQDWIATNCSEFIAKDEWPPNLPDLSRLGSYAWMLQVISTQAREHR